MNIALMLTEEYSFNEFCYNSRNTPSEVDFVAEILKNKIKNGIRIFCFKCEDHYTIMTPNHINITNPLSLSAILYEDHLLHEKF